MSWSLKLTNGDLDLRAASYGIVTGEAKLIQDLRCFILEKMGTDPLHPEFGSLIDGGRRPDGTVIDGVIGLVNNDLARLEVESDIRRIVREYQQRQLGRAREDKGRYGKTTFSRGEVLVALNSVDFEAVADTLNVTLVITTGNENELELALTFD